MGILVFAALLRYNNNSWAAAQFGILSEFFGAVRFEFLVVVVVAAASISISQRELPLTHTHTYTLLHIHTGIG